MPARRCRCFLESSALPPQAACGAERGGCRGKRGWGYTAGPPPSTHIHMQPQAVALAHVCHRAQRVEGAQHGGARGGADKEWHGTLGGWGTSVGVRARHMGPGVPWQPSFPWPHLTFRPLDLLLQLLGDHLPPEGCRGQQRGRGSRHNPSINPGRPRSSHLSSARTRTTLSVPMPRKAAPFWME